MSNSQQNENIELKPTSSASNLLSPSPLGKEKAKPASIKIQVPATATHLFSPVTQDTRRLPSALPSAFLQRPSSALPPSTPMIEMDFERISNMRTVMSGFGHPVTQILSTLQNSSLLSLNEKESTDVYDLVELGALRSPQPGEQSKIKKKKRNILHKLFTMMNSWDYFWLTLALLCSLFHSFLIPLITFVFGMVFDHFRLYQNQTIDRDTFAQLTLTDCLYFIIIAAISKLYYIIIAMLCTSFSHWIWTGIGQKQYNRILIRFYQNLLKQDIEWFDQSEESSFKHSFFSEAKKIQNVLSFPFPAMLKGIMIMFTSFGFALYCGWDLALIFFITIPLASLVSFIMKPRFMHSLTQARNYTNKIQIYFKEVLTGIQTVHAFNGQKFEEREMKKKLDTRMAYYHQFILTYCIFFFFHYLVYYGSYSLPYWYAGQLLFQQKLSAGNILQIFLMTIQALNGITMIANYLPEVLELSSLLGQLYEVIDRKPLIDVDYQDAKVKIEKWKTIKVEGVSFEYPQRENLILKYLSLNIEAGKFTALVGSSGCGKSTIAQLLMRFYDIKEGKILIDQFDLRTLNLNHWRSQIAVISQEPFLFNLSIKENLMLGNLETVPTPEDLIRVCRIAEIHEFISQLPEGYDTLIGTDSLSGGQKQRIVLARALLRNASLYILDEATSYLDLISESNIMANLTREYKHKTFLVIAHRLASIQHADKIYVLDKGNVKESGTHETLMKAKGLYWELQQLKVEPKPEEPIDRSPDGWRKSVEVSRMSTGTARMSMESSFELEQKVNISKIVRVLWFGLTKYKLQFLFGILTAAIFGLVQPGFSLIFSLTMTGFITDQPDVLLQNTQRNCLYFIYFSIGVALCSFIRVWFPYHSTSYAIMYLRQIFFESLMNKNVSWFDTEQHSVSELSNRMIDDLTTLQDFLLRSFFPMVEVLITAIVAFAIAFYYNWILTLISLGVILALAFFLKLENTAMVRFTGAFQSIYEQSEHIARQTIMTPRTVQAYGLRQYFVEKYKLILQSTWKKFRLHSILVSIAFGAGQSCFFFAEGLMVYAGSRLVLSNQLDFNSFVTVFSVLIFSAMTFSFLGDISTALSKSTLAADYFLHHLKPQHKEMIEMDKNDLKPDIRGRIEFKNVKFAYPSRPAASILKGLNLVIREGQMTAIVGSSGGGKSTLFRLLQRFYKPVTGSLFIDENSIRKLDLNYWRSHIGWVPQAPFLFNRSIRQNIIYGLEWEENKENDEKIWQVLKKACLNEFIESLPEKLDTIVGENGIQFSGGQRLRLAIARALIRKPKIYLLDEFTSSLDTQSEDLIQREILNELKDHTTLIIAHRLSTVQSCQQIVVIADGVVKEQGTHWELIQQKGIYEQLVIKDLEK